MSTATVEAPKTTPKTTATKPTLPETMRAIVAYAPGDYRLETVPVPRAGADEIIIKVEACGICAGDIKAYVGAESFWGGGGQPKYIKSPMIPGHEFLGNVVEWARTLQERAKSSWVIG
jgi:erythritol/L-threitol dehydrogenase